MAHRMVVGIDGTQGGVDAMALARRLSTPATELTAVSVALTDLASSSALVVGHGDHVRRRAQERLDDLTEQEPVGLRTEVLVTRSVGAGMHTAAQRVDADLIVIGSSRRGPIGRILAGDDVTATLRGAPCPVAVAPCDYARADAPIATIGLGWDGGDDGERALDVARSLATDTGSDLHAVGVVEMLPWPVSDETTTGAELAADVEVMAGNLAALADVESTTVTGDVVEELARFADEVDLLVVGSHQRGPVGRVLLGSTSEALARRSTRPLVVVPRTVPPAASAPTPARGVA